MVDKLWIVDEVEAGLVAKVRVAVMERRLRAAAATEVVAVVGAGPIAATAPVNLVGELAGIVCVGDRRGGREARRPRLRNSCGRAIAEIFFRLGSLSALMADLSHSVREGER